MALPLKDGTLFCLSYTRWNILFNANKNSDESYDDLDGLIEVISETQVYEGLTMEDIILPSPQMQVPAEALSPILNVTTIAPSPGPEWAAEKYAEEYENAELKYCSDTLLYTCAKKETENGGIYFLTHIVIKNANQINGSDSYGDFGGDRETPLDAAKRCGAKILTNGSHFDYGTGHACGGSLLIRHNKVVHGESGSARNILKGRWFLAPPVRSPTPDPTDSAVNMAYSASSSLHMNLLNSVSNCSRFGRYN